MGPQARVADATYGHQVATGFATHTLVGKVRLDASSQFYDNQDVGVLSWFFRRKKHAYRGFPRTGTFASGATAYTAIPGDLVNVLTWGQDALDPFAISNGLYSSGGVGNVALAVTLNGAATGFVAQGSAHATNYYAGLHASAPGSGFGEGNHTIGAAIAAGTSSKKTVS